MQFYSLHFIEERIELYTLERDQTAANLKGAVNFDSERWSACYEFAVALSKAKQVPLVDHAQSV